MLNHENKEADGKAFLQEIPNYKDEPKTKIEDEIVDEVEMAITRQKKNKDKFEVKILSKEELRECV